MLVTMDRGHAMSCGVDDAMSPGGELAHLYIPLTATVPGNFTASLPIITVLDTIASGVGVNELGAWYMTVPPESTIDMLVESTFHEKVLPLSAGSNCQWNGAFNSIEFASKKQVGLLVMFTIMRPFSGEPVNVTLVLSTCGVQIWL
jgi:hypothetical protein